jgi:hypothetical protein
MAEIPVARARRGAFHWLLGSFATPQTAPCPLAGARPAGTRLLFPLVASPAPSGRKAGSRAPSAMGYTPLEDQRPLRLFWDEAVRLDRREPVRRRWPANSVADLARGNHARRPLPTIHQEKKEP